MNEAENTLDAGIASADPQRAREHAEVKQWKERVEKARKFDEEALKQYALDRGYARGDSGFAVDANLIGTFIDILTAFLYAKDPDVDVLPARATEPPSMEALRDAAGVDLDEDPAVQMRLAKAAEKATQAMMVATLAPPPNPLEQVGAALGVVPPTPPPMTPEHAVAAEREAIIQERFDALQAAYRKRQRDNKAFAETLELVIGSLWKQARTKARARPWVRSGLTIAVGWVKASWQERMGKDPMVVQKIADMRDNIQLAAALKAQIDEEQGAQQDLLIAKYEAQIAALQGQAERVLARGFAIDNVNAEDITVAPGVELGRYLDAAWIDHRIPMRVDDIVAEFNLDQDKAKQIARYAQRKPVMRGTDSPNAKADQTRAEDADQFTEGSAEQGDWGMVHETWDRDANRVLTWIEGVKCWARPPVEPLATTRFYPFFAFILGETDGQRHPQSLVARSAKLVDEYNRIGTAEREHRARVKPKTGFNAGQMSPESAKRLEGGTTCEMVAIEPTNPQTPIGDILHPIQYPALDPALYDRSRIYNELERIWGVQEALSGGVTVDKTATEAQIQQSGMQARTSSQRDILEDALSELALYTAQVARAKLTAEDVQAMVGPDAMWPEYTGAEDLTRMVNVDIRAGSSGRPNTTAEQQAWATLLPMLQSGVTQVAQLRQSAPADVADSIEKLLRMTIERSGQRIDVEAIVPPAGPAQPVLPGLPGMAPGPQAPTGAPTDPTPAPPAAA